MNELENKTDLELFDMYEHISSYEWVEEMMIEQELAKRGWDVVSELQQEQDYV